jgi:hypothetical protein
MIKSVKKINDIKTNEFSSYQLITVKGEVWTVPLDEGNKDYQAIQEWVADGNTIEEAD